MISKKPLFSWILGRFYGLQALLFTLILAAIFFRVFPLEMQKRIVNSAIALKQLDALFLYCGLYLGAVVLAGLFKYWINVLQGYIGQRVLLELRAKLYDHILSLPVSFFRRTPPGMVIASLTSELSVIGEFMGGAIAIPVINILTLAAFAAYLAYLNPLLAGLSFAIYPFEIIIIPFLQARFNKLNRHRIDVTRSLSNLIGEAVSGIHEIHGNAGFRLEGGKLQRLARNLFSIRHRMNIFKFLIKFTNNFFQSLGPFILFLLGGYLTIQGRFDLGALVAFLSAYEKLYDPWRELMDYYQGLQDSRVRYRQVMDYFDIGPEFALEPPEPRAPIVLEGGIEVEDLHLAVDGRTRLLQGVSLRLEPGERMAIVGPSGSGKSTLAMVVGQLYNYQEGRVLLDGRELKTLTKLDVSRNIGYVPQYPFIFDGSLLDNLLYGCRSLQREGQEQSDPECREIFQVLEWVGLTEDVLRFGLQAALSRDQNRELIERVIACRRLFLDRWQGELVDSVDFFDSERFLHHATIAENLTFGSPHLPQYLHGQLPRNRLFLDFLMENELIEPMVRLGKTLTIATVSLLSGMEGEAFFFEKSPIAQEEFESYRTIADRIQRVGIGGLTKSEEQALLELSLRFIPSEHKMAVLPRELERKILAARPRFMAKILEEDSEAFSFYLPDQYLFLESIITNILFGYPKSDHPKAMVLVQQKIMELLQEQGLIEDIMHIGLQFQVGSKGDRLSGGQKQKVAIARALLKSPRILILDEATASLDNTSQAKIQRLIGSELKGKFTVISVVHRLELVKDFELIVVMKSGKIAEMGSYEELMAGKGLFYELSGGS